MLKISRKMEYALMALEYMQAKPRGQAATARELSESCKISFDSTSKALQSLAQAQWVSSIKGIKGGYILTIDLSKVSYYQLYQIIEGKTHLVACLEGQQKCELSSHCKIMGPIKNLESFVGDVFQKLSLEQLFQVQPMFEDSLEKLS